MAAASPVQAAGLTNCNDPGATTPCFEKVWSDGARKDRPRRAPVSLDYRVRPPILTTICQQRRWTSVGVAVRSGRFGEYNYRCACIAQLVEQLTLNQLVPGSNPGAGILLLLRSRFDSLSVPLRLMFRTGAEP